MNIIAALACDAAEVREGLLFILGGGITRLWRTSWPGPLGISVAAVIEMTPGEARAVHELTLRIQTSDGQRIGELKAGIQVGIPPVAEGTPGAPHAGEMIVIPVVLPLQGAAIPGPGAYDLRLAVDRNAATSRLTVWAEHGVPPPRTIGPAGHDV